jgi:hypothetical protein
MLSVLLAISAMTHPVAPQAAALTKCAPDRHSACSKPAAVGGNAANNGAIRPGKRCHSDPSKSVGCREILVSNADARATRVSAR